MSAETGSSKADTLVKVVLVFFISLLSFSVGTFVGKQVSDSDHRRLALEGESKGGHDVATTDEHTEAGEEKISEQEVESLTEEFVNKEKNAEAAANTHASNDEHKSREIASTESAEDGYKSYKRGSDPKHEQPSASPKHSPAPAAEGNHGEPAEHAPAPAKHSASKTEPPQKAAEKVAHDEAPTDGHKEVRKPTATLPSVASSAVGKYTIQVASYAEEKEAEGHAAGLKSKGWSAFYLPATVSGKTWYRVLVGLFENSKSANDFRAQFMKESSTKSAIVQKIVQ